MKNCDNKHIKVCIGLSGGVDSSVAALLLKQQGYDVFALFMQNWHDASTTLHGDCEWEEDRFVAEMVAKKIGIPFHFVDLSDIYRQKVVDYMFSEYEKGRTPNPDVLCNREIKFDAFLKCALELGVDYVATGHYCKKDEFVNENGEKYVVIDEPKAKLVRYAFEQVAKGVKTPTLVWKEVQNKGLKVSESSFFEMLRNHFYCGEVYVPEYLDEPAQYVVGVHEPLISKELFMQVQSRLNSVAPRNRSKEKQQRAKVVKLPHEDYYFYPFLQCPVCGAKICASHSKGRSQTYAYYHCNHCKKYRVPAQQMNDDILRHIRQIRPCKAVLDLYEEVLNDIRTEKFKGINKEKNRIQEDVKKVEVRLQRLQDRFLDGEISSDDYKEIRQRYNDEIYALRSQIEILKTPNRSVIEPQMAYAMSFINNIERCLSSVEMSVKMDVLGSMLSGKMVFENGKCRTAEFNPIIALLY